MNFDIFSSSPSVNVRVLAIILDNDGSYFSDLVFQLEGHVGLPDGESVQLVGVLLEFLHLETIGLVSLCL